MGIFNRISVLTAASVCALGSVSAQTPVIKGFAPNAGTDSFIAGSYIPYSGSAGRKQAMSMLFAMCASAINWNDRVFIVGDTLVRPGVHWVRDHALASKSSRYVKTDMTSFLNLLLENQTSDGFFYEILAPETDIHGGDISSEKFRKLLPNTGYGLCRLEIEADVEYLMVEGVYYAWQATGDDQWLKKALPKLEKGLNYIMTDPTRWDKTYELAKRVYTIDTWDFTNEIASQNVRDIFPIAPMGIMHGDNTGLYRAMRLLAKMYDRVGDAGAAAKWNASADSLKVRIDKYLWNGKFYKHYLPLDKVDLGVDLENQMTLSNSYDINRMDSPEKAREVLRQYRLMREKFSGEFDDFRTINPAFPVFKTFKSGRYTNGAIGFFVAGELAAAAFKNGMEQYGFDILERCAKKVLADGKLSFLYNYDGKDVAGGPRAWVGSELMFGLVEGLAGVVDNGCLFKDVEISPRWVVSREKKARVFLKYPVSGAYVDYAFEWDKPNGKIFFTLHSKHDRATVRILLPAGAENATASVGGKIIESRIEDVFSSKYLLLENFSGNGRVEISYSQGIEVLPYVTLVSDSAGIYITNNLEAPQKCTVDVRISGWESLGKRTFTLLPYEKRHVEVLPLKKVPNNGAEPRVIIERNGATFSFPITKIGNRQHHIDLFKTYGAPALEILLQ